MRESVVTAQDMGIQVVLLTFEPTKRTGRSTELVREVDEAVVLETDFWTPHFERLIPEAAVERPTDEVLVECASAFARGWLDGATHEETLALKGRRDIPRELYVQLIVSAEKQVGDLKPYPDTKPVLRKAFWSAFSEATVGDEAAAHREADEVES